MGFTNMMKSVMNLVIASNGICLAMWIFSKAVLNIVKASNAWVGANERSDYTHDEVDRLNFERDL